MSREKITDIEIHKVVAEVCEDVLVSLKILALKKRLSLTKYVTEVLDKHVYGKAQVIDKAEEIVR
jgi:hypothetical protein